MEGPTPVSALIHAATLVTAGVYLMLRISPVLEYASTTLIMTSFVGAVTAVFAATSALAQTDIKRVIAYSTCSQVGYMFIGLGLGQYNLALFHLANHAAFKAILFIAAGAVIHAFLDQQDLRRYGGLVLVLPVVYSSLIIGSLSLMAVPYLTGWYSKDGILEVAIGSYTIPGSAVYLLGTTVAGLTAFYSIRLVLLAFLTGPRSDYTSYTSVHDANAFVMTPLVTLSLLSIMLGYMSSDLFRGMGSDFLATSTPVTPTLIVSVDAEFANITAFKLGPLGATLLGSITAYWLYMTPYGLEYLSKLNRSYVPVSLYRFFSAQWHFDAFIIAGIITPALGLGHGISKVLDRGLLEALGPYGLQRGFSTTATTASLYSTGVLTDYAMYIVLGMLTCVVCFALPSLGFLSEVVPFMSSSNIIPSATGITILIVVNTVSAYLVSKIEV